MENKPIVKGEVVAKDEASKEDDVAVKNAIERLNSLYALVCENAQTIRNIFIDCGIKSRYGFYNNHAVAVGDGYINELYPIPVVTAIIEGVSADIGFDIVSRNGNIGFLELTVDKAVLIGLDFSKLSAYAFAVYGVKHYLTDYQCGDEASTKELIAKSDEKQFHIGFEFADMADLKQLLDVFGITTNKVGGKISGGGLKRISD